MNTPSLQSIKARPRKKVQATSWQQDGAETAEAFGEPHRTALYARFFKAHPLERAKLIECREWCLKVVREKGGHPGKLFVSCYKKFL
jgi:hypothetical protein